MATKIQTAAMVVLLATPASGQFNPWPSIWSTFGPPVADLTELAAAPCSSIERDQVRVVRDVGSGSADFRICDGAGTWNAPASGGGSFVPDADPGVDHANYVDANAAVATHAASASAHHAKTVDAAELTTGTIAAARVGASHIDALGELDGDLCGTNEILEDQGGGWSCISTPTGGGGSGTCVDYNNDGTCEVYVSGGVIHFDPQGNGSSDFRMWGGAGWDFYSAYIHSKALSTGPSMRNEPESLTNPIWSFKSDNDSGLGGDGAGTLSLISDGSSVVELDSAAVDVHVTGGTSTFGPEGLSLGYGGVMSGYDLEFDTSNGFRFMNGTLYYDRNGAPYLAIADGRVESAGANPSWDLLASSAGGLDAPIYRIDGDENTGIGASGSDDLTLIAGGARRLSIDATGAFGIEPTDTPAACDDAHRGWIYFDDSLGEHCGCRGAAGSSSWQQLDGGGAC